MKIFNITKNISVGFGAWDGVCNKSKTQLDKTLYTEVWIGKVICEYPKDLTCTLYVFGFFRILFYNSRRG